MRDDARIHKRCGGIAIFVTEISAKQLLRRIVVGPSRRIDVCRDLAIAFQIDTARLPVSCREIAINLAQSRLNLLRREFQDRIDDAVDAALAGRAAFITEMERPHDDARRICAQPQRQRFDGQQSSSPRTCGRVKLRLAQSSRAGVVTHRAQVASV